MFGDIEMFDLMFEGFISIVSVDVLTLNDRVAVLKLNTDSLKCQFRWHSTGELVIYYDKSIPSVYKLKDTAWKMHSKSVEGGVIHLTLVKEPI